jgi:hypothetical protein
VSELAGQLEELVGAGPRVLVIDIETAPAVAYVWGMFRQNVGLPQLQAPGRVICFAAKWHGERKVLFYSEHHDGHAEMVDAAYQLLAEADIVVGWNSKAFDTKHLMREFILAGHPPLGGFREVDLLLTARKRFKFQSNKLDHVADQLGCGRKVKHTGFELWAECLAGDDKAWALMKRYNIGDVKLTERVLDVLRPWIPGFPHQGLYGGARAGCPRCGSLNVAQEKYTRKVTGRYTKWRCLDCTGLFEGSHRVEAVHHKAI